MNLGAFKRLLALCGFPQRGGNLPRVLAQSAVPASVTGTLSETTLATIAIPAGAMGVNGALRIYLRWNTTSNANGKALIARIGGVAFSNFTTSNSGGYADQLELCNRNATNSQVGRAVATASPFGQGASATFSIDTSVAQNLTLSVQLTNVGDTASLEEYRVEILNP